MEQFQTIIEGLELLKTNEEVAELYQNCFDDIIKEVEPEQIEEAMRSAQGDAVFLAPLYAGALFQKRRFEDMRAFLQGLDLAGSDRAMDFYNGKLIKYLYLCLKYLGLSIAPLYKLIVFNSEHRNTYSTAVAANAILDFQINSGIYMRLPDSMVGSLATSDTAEGARYALYLGIIALIRGEYSAALDLLNRADILNKSRSLELKLKKYIIVTKLLLSNYSIYYPYMDELSPYFALIGAVRRAEVASFYAIIDQYRAEFSSLSLYFVVRRLLSNLLREGLRRVSVCYSRITVSDISRALGVDADYLIHSALSSGFIPGYVENGVYYSASSARNEEPLGKRTREVIGVRKTVIGMMDYPAIAPLTYEVVLEREAKANN